MKKIGLTLGGGGARGFAHIPILEVFDELDITPHCITGTSIGAIVGALYASGYSAQELAEMMKMFSISSKPNATFFKESLSLLSLVDPIISLKPKGLFKGEKILNFLYKQLKVSTFEELKIPLKIVATDFWNGKEVVFESGDLLTALHASMAIPYLFQPVTLNGTVLVDGGLVNNVPHDLLDTDCDIRIAVDILGTRSTPQDKAPSPVEALGHSYQVLIGSISKLKLEQNPVDIYIHPPIIDIELMEFHKARAIYEQGLAAKADFKQQLETLLNEKEAKKKWWNFK